jgi:hypothetical protein
MRVHLLATHGGKHYQEALLIFLFGTIENKKIVQ